LPVASLEKASVFTIQAISSCHLRQVTLQSASEYVVICVILHGKLTQIRMLSLPAGFAFRKKMKSDGAYRMN